MHQYSVHLANSLAEKAEVEVIGYKSIFPLWLYPGKSKSLSGEVPLREDIQVYDILKYYSLLSSFKAASIIRQRIRADVVHIQWIAPQHGFVLIPLMLLLRYCWAGRIFLTVHNVSPHERRPFDRAFSRLAFRLSHRIFVHAEALKEELTKSFCQDPKKIAPIRHGLCASAGTRYAPVDARARLGINEDRVILFFGFVRPYKGLSDLIVAFKELINRFNVALVIAGEFFGGWTEYQNELERHGVANRTYLFPRYIPFEEVPLFFSAADIVVQPYVRFSGQSGVTQTAYLYSVPVVATDVGGLPELVLHGKTGLVTKPGDPEVLRSALETLLADDGMRREYGDNGKKFLDSELSWVKISQRLLEVYGEA
jgi:glycosyltransferase involved in cell wall biosynthesis